MACGALRPVLAVLVAVPTYLVALPLLLALRLLSFVLLDVPILVMTCACKRGAEKRSLMRAGDSFMLMETESNRCNIIAALELDVRAFDLGKLRSAVQGAFISCTRAGDGLLNELRWPRFQQRPVYSCGRWYWESMGDTFNLSEHVWEKTGVSDEASLASFLGELQSSAMDRSRPLWDCVLVHPAAPGGRPTLVFRLHHAMGDGISLMRVLLEAMEYDPPPAGSPAAVGHRSRGTPADWALVALHAPLLAVEQLLQRKDGNGLKPQALQGQKRAAFSPAISLARVKDVARAHKSTVTALVSACFARGIAGMEGFDAAGAGGGKSPPKFWVPVSLSGADGGAAEMRNDLCYLMMPLPTGAGSAAAALGAAGRCLEDMKTSHQAPALLRVIQVSILLLPLWFAQPFLNWIGDKATGVLSSVPGPAAELSFGGAKVASLRFLVPQRSGFALGLSAVSYGGSLRIGVSADRAALSRPELLVEGWRNAFEELAASAQSSGN